MHRLLIALIERGADIDVEDANGQSPLHLAAEANRAISVELLLNSGAQLDLTEELTQLSPLHYAVRSGNEQLFGALLARGMSVTSRNESGRTPLHEAVAEAHIGILKKAGETGVDLSILDSRKRNLLHWACSCGHTEQASRFKEVLTPSSEPITDEHIALDRLHQLTRADRSMRAIYKIVPNHASSPIEFHGRLWYISVTTSPLHVGMYLYGAPKQYDTPTVPAYARFRLSILGCDKQKRIIRNGTGAIFSTSSGWGWHELAPVSEVIDIPGYLTTDKALMIRLKIELWDPTTIHQHAAFASRDDGHQRKNKRKECVDYLLAHNIDIHACSIDGWTPLHLAAQRKEFQLIQLLLSKGANPNQKDNEGRTALHWLIPFKIKTWLLGKVKRESEKALAVLIEHGTLPRLGQIVFTARKL
eukprot:TRINITY_DN7803_c0_g1_i3.p1 TRINITY_DN7803_c0_g1~~TRINITY_DN7803_c0_g1_i3.p1  ORF type:complete len:417 (-),score=43.98 TRINITY_DN7803_c0_g1_i3:34-1284(-)